MSIPPPIHSGQLTLQQKEKLANWLSSKAPLIGKCSICGSRSWTIADHLFDLPIYRGGSVMIGGGPSYPAAAIVCTSCGNFQFISAVVSGVLAQPDQPAASNTAPKPEEP